MSRLRVLETAEELHQFGERYAEVSRHVAPMAYLAHATVYGYFLRGEMIGGFTLSDRAPFRVIEGLPADARRKLADELDFDDMVESGCAWLQPQYRGLGSLSFWWEVSAQAARTGRRWRLGATCVPGLARLYNAVGLPQVYRGLLEFESDVHHNWVFSDDLSQWRQTMARGAWCKIRRGAAKRRVPASVPAFMPLPVYVSALGDVAVAAEQRRRVLQPVA
jgi:hypothetical protein